MGKLFGTDGIRGVANKGLDSILAYKLGQACALQLTDSAHHARILIGKDTRISGDMLESALVAGICSAGATAELLGVVPTPAVAYLTRLYHADAGIVISASHNTVEYNGLKVFNGQGYKLADEIEEKIEERILSAQPQELPSGIQLGRRVERAEAAEDYGNFLRQSADCSLKGLHIVLDTANGASYKIAPQVFSALGAKVDCIGNAPDGTNINDACGSTHPEKLQEAVKQLGADLGLAFDGDADRLIAVDEQGRLVDGDRVMAVCALDMKARGKLAKNTVVGTVMSNLGLQLYLQKHGIHLVKTAVGDRYVLEEMLASGYNFGGEQSGHVIILDKNTTGDAMLTALQLLSVVVRSGKKLGELAYDIEILPQVLINARVREENKYAYQENEQIRQEIAKVEEAMAGRGRVLIRPSGTEPLVRVMIEGEDIEFIRAHAEKVAQLIEQTL